MSLVHNAEPRRARSVACAGACRARLSEKDRRGGTLRAPERRCAEPRASRACRGERETQEDREVTEHPASTAWRHVADRSCLRRLLLEEEACVGSGGPADAACQGLTRPWVSSRQAAAGCGGRDGREHGGVGPYSMGCGSVLSGLGAPVNTAFLCCHLPPTTPRRVGVATAGMFGTPC